MAGAQSWHVPWQPQTAAAAAAAAGGQLACTSPRVPVTSMTMDSLGMGSRLAAGAAASGCLRLSDSLRASCLTCRLLREGQKRSLVARPDSQLPTCTARARGWLQPILVRLAAPQSCGRGAGIALTASRGKAPCGCQSASSRAA